MHGFFVTDKLIIKLTSHIAFSFHLYVQILKCVNLTLATPLFKGSDVLTRWVIWVPAGGVEPSFSFH